MNAITRRTALLSAALTTVSAFTLTLPAQAATTAPTGRTAGYETHSVTTVVTRSPYRAATTARDAIYRTNGTQVNAVWHLSRLNRKTKMATNSVGTYTYPDGGGTGVKIYIVDSGIQTGLTDFGDRLQPGYDATTNTTGTTVDCNGHGTAVASVAASTTYGVAKKATIIPVRVTDCNGWATGTNITRGLNWILTNHKTGTPGVVNISLGSLDPARTPGYTPQDTAVANLVRKGLFVTISAGNDSTRTWSGTNITTNTVIDACQASPARVTTAFTVGAFDPLTGLEARSEFSNAGSCVDAWAPGVDVKALTRTGCRSSWWGTSFAAPIAAGLAALTLGKTPKSTPAQVATALISNGQRNMLANTPVLPLDATHRYTKAVGAGYLVKATSKSVNVMLRAPQ